MSERPTDTRKEPEAADAELLAPSLLTSCASPHRRGRRRAAPRARAPRAAAGRRLAAPAGAARPPRRDRERVRRAVPPGHGDPRAVRGGSGRDAGGGSPRAPGPSARAPLRARAPGRRPRGLGRPGALVHAATNLLANALEAVEERGDGTRVLVRVLRASAGGLEVRVSDEGVGIAPEHRARVFEPGFTTKAGSGAAGSGCTSPAAS